MELPSACIILRRLPLAFGKLPTTLQGGAGAAHSHYRILTKLKELSPGMAPPVLTESFVTCILPRESIQQSVTGLLP